MQSQELLEVAGLVAANGQSLICDQPELPEQSLADYWVASRCRFDSWGYDLRTYSLAASKTQAHPFSDRLFRLAVEIEASEVLARTMAAVGLAHDTVHQLHETASVTANVLAGHRDIAVRLNAVLASRNENSFRQLARFRNLRSRLHRLTDQFVACLMPLAPVAPFAYDSHEVARRGEEAAMRIARGGEPVEWTELKTDITGLRRECGEAGPNAEQSKKVAAAVMGLFAPEMFDSFGLLRSTWIRRLERVEDETGVLIDQWLATDGTDTAIPTHRLPRS